MPPTLLFNPLATGIGVFVAVAIPIVVVGFGANGAASRTIAVVAIVIGLVAGLLAGLWVEHRGGRVWRGRQL